jgi:FkbM family methyltransferase
MISRLKKLLKKLLPAPFFRVLYSLYGHSLFYAVKLFRYTLIATLFRTPQFIIIRHSNLHIKINPTNGYTDKNLFLFRERDTDLIELMKEKLHPGSIMVDIGANIGYETIWGASLVGESGKVYSFEPLPSLAHQIRESLEKNNFHNVTLINKALGEVPGAVTIYTHAEDAGLSSIEHKEGAADSVEVPITTLDEELKDVQRISFIKIDIEGYEFEALKGASHLLERDHPLIVFEFTPKLYEQSYEGKSKDLLLFLADKGYGLRVADSSTLLSGPSLDAFVNTMKKEERMVNMIAEYTRG